MTDAQASSSADHQQMLDRIRAAVRNAVPVEATVLVVSRGDEELLELGNRNAWHFPREPDGRYAGYHPRDSADALSLLDRWRSRGAGFLVLPETGFWWLDYYGDFRDSLRRDHGVAFEGDACIVYRLGDGGPRAAALEAIEPVIDHIVDFVDRLLPDDAAVAVVSSGDERLARLRGRRVAHFPPLPGATEAGEAHQDPGSAIDALEELRDVGFGHLVIPDVAPSWLDRSPAFLPAVEGRYRRLAGRAGICLVFSLNEPAGKGAGS